MKTIIFTSIFCFVAIIIMGQDNSIEIRKNKQGFVEYVKFAPTQSSEEKQVTPPETASDFFKEYLKTTSFTSFIIQPQKQLDKDFVHEHYNQYYNGIKVDGGGYNFHFKKGRLYLAHGNYVKVEGVSTKPVISAEEAKGAFVRYKEIPVEEVTDFKADLLIFKDSPLIPNMRRQNVFYLASAGKPIRFIRQYIC